MDRDYESLLPKVLTAMFPENKQRQAVIETLSAYGRESFHREPHRVHLGILKLVWAEPEKLEAYTELACTDYRDLLCAAEYPLSSRRFGLQEKNPKKYRKLQEQESAEYEAWLKQVLPA